MGGENRKVLQPLKTFYYFVFDNKKQWILFELIQNSHQTQYGRLSSSEPMGEVLTPTSPLYTPVSRRGKGVYIAQGLGNHKIQQ